MYSRYANRVNTERLPAVWKKLAAAPPKRRVALIRSLRPGIEAALTSGQNLKDIWEALETEGLHVNYHTFYVVVWRARGKPTAASTRPVTYNGASPVGNERSILENPA